VTDCVVATVNLKSLSVRDGTSSHTLPTPADAIFGEYRRQLSLCLCPIVSLEPSATRCHIEPPLLSPFLPDFPGDTPIR